VRTHHEGVDEDVVVLEGVEGRGGGDAVLAGLAELQRRHDAGEGAEYEVVEEFHGDRAGGDEARSPGKEGERVVGFGGGDFLVRILVRMAFGSTGFWCEWTRCGGGHCVLACFKIRRG
jgi:hypothetical protein